ncbi:MAG: LacI family DNA-binding transcriptional regulator [Sphaerochaeta sp.]|nr:LacI family DNA-binding transcriptional regulator [Sphaerochaeta sp.]
MKYTINELAKLCKTSPATISRITNNPELVSQPLRERIENTMKEVGYKPNPFASRLSSNSTWGLGLFVFDILNPFFALIVRNISHLAMEEQIPLTVCDTENNEEKENLYLEYLLDTKVEGIIFAEGISLKTIEKAKKYTRVVLIDSHYHHGSISEVHSDNYGGACLAVEHLIALNHTKIGFVGGPEDWPTAHDRFLGYEGTLRKHNIPIRSDFFFPGDLRFESGGDAIDTYISLQDKPTAIFCANDQMAYGALARAKNCGIAIPGDLSIVGFDDIPLYNVFDTKLTTVHQDIQALSEHSFNLLFPKDKKSDFSNNPKEVTVPTTLVPGQTCRALPSNH